jgi:tetratricopeptide (TPR) repeat protein
MPTISTLPQKNLINLVSLFILMLNASFAFAGKYFDFSPNAQDAYKKAVSLRFNESNVQLYNLRTYESDNLLEPYIANYVDFLTVFLNEDKDEYKRLLKNMDGRLEKIAKGDKSSPYYLFTQAEIRLQWAILRGKFGDYLSAINETKQAFALLEQNQKKFPDFVPNKKNLGVMHALVGNVPDEYRWAIKLFGGMDGSIQQGLKEVEEVIAYGKKHKDFVYTEEALVSYSFLLLHLGNQSESAWKTMNSGALNHKENPLAAFALSNIAMKIGKNDEAIKILEECATGSQYHPFLYRNFMLGLAKLQRLDWDANKPLEYFVNNFKGMYGIKEAYQKLAWFHLIADNPSGYNTYIKYTKLKGSDRFEPDKAALREADSGEIPDPLLTKGRLLFDGGYHQRAYDLLRYSAGNFTGNTKKNLEYHYRMGRIAHKLGKAEEAMQAYNKTITEGEQQPWYFACNAALQLGTMHEERKEYKSARLAFNRCLKIKPDEYGASLHARAKVGLNRIKGK